MSPAQLNSRSTAANDVSDVLYLTKTVWTAGYDCKLDNDVLASVR